MEKQKQLVKLILVLFVISLVLSGCEEDFSGKAYGEKYGCNIPYATNYEVGSRGCENGNFFSCCKFDKAYTVEVSKQEEPGFEKECAVNKDPENYLDEEAIVHLFKIKEKDVSGCSITGGYVYRGNEIVELKGRYLFGDYCTGKIFSISNASKLFEEVSFVIAY